MFYVCTIYILLYFEFIGTLRVFVPELDSYKCCMILRIAPEVQTSVPHFYSCMILQILYDIKDCTRSSTSSVPDFSSCMIR
jgi:hypothetical protein